MRTLCQFLVWGLIPSMLLVAGCRQDTVEPNNHFFRIYETTPVPALGLDAVPTQGGYVILSQTYSLRPEYKWEGGSPLFIQTNATGDIDYTHFWENYNATEKFAQPYPYLLSSTGDSVVRTIGYHRKNIDENDKGCFISFNAINGTVDTCWENCPAWNLDAAPDKLLGAALLDDKATLVAKRDPDNIVFVKFNASGEKEAEYIDEDIYHQYGSYVEATFSKNSIYYTSKHNFFKMKEYHTYVQLIAPDEDGDPRLFWFPSSFDGDNIRYEAFLPEDDWAYTDSFNILIRFSFNAYDKVLRSYFRYKSKRLSYELNYFENVYKYNIFNTKNYILVSIINLNGNSELLKISKRDQNFQEDLKKYSNLVLGKPDTIVSPLATTSILKQANGSRLEISAVRELVDEDGKTDFLICGTIYRQSDAPRPFLMRVDENGNF